MNIDNSKRRVIFDTGSNIVWVQGTKKSEIFNCKDFKTCLFEKSNLESLKDSAYKIKYGTGEVFISSKKGKINFENGIYKITELDNFIYGISIYEEKSIFEKVIFDYFKL